ncbi:hypothetical protein [Arcobacter defluvii]|nr:hypothetical protein [Arcobacter defluvii]
MNNFKDYLLNTNKVRVKNLEEFHTREKEITSINIKYLIIKI